VESLIEWGVAQGCTDFYLDVYSRNESALRAYEKAGFAPLQVQMHYAPRNRRRTPGMGDQ